VLGLGSTAKSHAFGSVWYEHRPVAYGPLRTNRLPGFYALASPWDEERRGYAIRNLALFGKISLAAFRRLFCCELAEVPDLSRALRDLEASGVVRWGSDAVAWATLDPVERLVCLKHLYSRRVVRGLLERHAGRYREFLRRYPAPDGSLRQALQQKAQARSLFRVYFR